MPQKRTLESFFQPASKQKRLSKGDKDEEPDEADTVSSPILSVHSTYPFPIAHLPEDIIAILSTTPAGPPKVIDQQQDLDILYFAPFIPPSIARRLFTFFRAELPFYRVRYKIKRGHIETQINTPRYTTVFGVDSSARFAKDGSLVSASSGTPLSRDYYQCRPRPIPDCLNVLRMLTEACTGTLYNFALVNYYASGDDSISYHSDDERFLGRDPSIASFSLGAIRDFLMKHKQNTSENSTESPLKLQLGSGDMILMRGKTQSCWLHSIPKRKGIQAEGGRINITFRKVLVRTGTENYYHYNVGSGEVYQWSRVQNTMAIEEKPL